MFCKEVLLGTSLHIFLCSWFRKDRAAIHERYIICIVTKNPIRCIKNQNHQKVLRALKKKERKETKTAVNCSLPNLLVCLANTIKTNLSQASDLSTSLCVCGVLVWNLAMSWHTGLKMSQCLRAVHWEEKRAEAGCTHWQRTGGVLLFPALWQG